MATMALAADRSDQRPATIPQASYGPLAVLALAQIGTSSDSAAMNLATAIEIKISCNEDEMLEMKYQTPTGAWNPDKMVSGGTGKGEILLYRREFGRNILIDRLLVKGAGCEYTGKRS